MSSLATPTVWRTALTIANLFMAACMTARARALDHGMATVRLLSQRDHLYTQAALLERELEIFRSMRSRKPPRERTHYSPEEPGQILMLMRLRHWSAKRTAERFGVQAADHVQHPTAPHCVWHLGMTELRVLWLKVEIAVLLDGFTRKIVAIKAFGRRPRTEDLIALVADAIHIKGVRPRFLITDNGGQFKGCFGDAIGELGPKHIRTTKRTWQLNAKLERVNRSIKAWARRAMLVPSISAIQQCLDAYAEWHNCFRPHAAHGSLTPCEVEELIKPNTPVRFAQNSEFYPVIGVRRMAVRGHPRLAYMRITVRQTLERAA